MQARTLLNFILLVLVAALAAIAWFEPGRQPPPPVPRQLVALDREQVREIRIEQPGRPAVVLVRDGDDWHMSAPVGVPANRFRVNGLFDALRARSLASFDVTAPEALAQYGLATPAVTVTLDDTVIAFGAVSPVDQRRYVRVGNRVHLIADTAFYHLVGDFPTFVSLNPLGPSPRIAGLRLPALALAHGEGRWQAEPPGPSADQINALVDAWRMAQAIQVVAWKGGETAGTVEVRLEGRAAPLVFAIAADGKDFTLVRPDLNLAWEFPAGVGDGLLKVPAAVQ